ncbi:hypothetical protein KI387_011524, partial [Taxus chinensis]
VHQAILDHNNNKLTRDIQTIITGRKRGTGKEDPTSKVILLSNKISQTMKTSCSLLDQVNHPRHLVTSGMLIREPLDT